MPKEGPSKDEWRKRLNLYAAGKFNFNRGQRPGKASPWAKEVLNIENCPMHGSLTTGRDLFGNVVNCVCGYHKNVQQV